MHNLRAAYMLVDLIFYHSPGDATDGACFWSRQYDTSLILTAVRTVNTMTRTATYKKNLYKYKFLQLTDYSVCQSYSK